LGIWVSPTICFPHDSLNRRHDVVWRRICNAQPSVLGRRGWQKVSTPSAASQINYVAFNGSNHWFIVDRKQGFYRSTDQGASWTQINSGLTTTLGWTINVNPAKGGSRRQYLFWARYQCTLGNLLSFHR